MQDNCGLVIAKQSLYQTAALVIIKDRESFYSGTIDFHCNISSFPERLVKYYANVRL